ncbi:MAG: hypothetical protein VYA34_17320 [Myxococcota bacterium]|nr:hypothetical protein [Myxococcota bacterium]
MSLPLGVEILDAQVASVGLAIVLRNLAAVAHPLWVPAIDGAKLSGILGTTAGSDHAFAAVAGRNAPEALARWMGK